jgi:hypothetical protein
MSTRVDDCKAAWESRDVARIVALYAPDATHASHLVPRFLPEAGDPVCHRVDGTAELQPFPRRRVANGLLGEDLLDRTAGAVLDAGA